MEQTYIVNGTVENGQLIHLDEPVPISGKRVSAIIKPAPQKSYNGEAFVAWLEQLHERRKKQGIKSLTKEEIDAWIQVERDSWGD
jgi:hypothetical protein